MKLFAIPTCLVIFLSLLPSFGGAEEGEGFVPPAVTLNRLLASKAVKQNRLNKRLFHPPRLSQPSSPRRKLFSSMPASLGRLPVLHNGRVKPLAVAARQSLQAVTAARILV